MRHVVFALLGFCLLSASAQAATYYVSPAGTGSTCVANGQATNQMQNTIRAGLACLSPGDTLLAKSGFYDESLSTPTTLWPSGTNGNPITVKSEVKHGAVIKPLSYPPASTIVYIRGAHDLVFDGFTVDGSGAGAGALLISTGEIGNGCQRIVIQNNDVGNSPWYDYPNQGGYWTFGISTDNDDSDMWILDNYVHDIATQAFTAPDPTVNYNYGMYTHSINTTIARNEFARIGAHAIHYHAQWQCPQSGGHTCGPYLIYNNIFYDLGFSAIISQNIGSGDILFYNNIIYRTSLFSTPGVRESNAIMMRNPGPNIRVWNNTLYDNSGNEAIWAEAPNVVIRNNIIYNNSNNAIKDTTGTADIRNNLQGPDPLFLSPDTTPPNFHLPSSGSPAFHYGITGAEPGLNLDYDGVNRGAPGGQSDAGAYQAGGTIIIPPDTLLAWWTFEGDTGTTAEDTSGSVPAHPGTLVGGASFGTGKLGVQALVLNGGASHMAVAGLIGTPAKLTIEAWFRVDTAPTSGAAALVSLGDYVTVFVTTTELYALSWDGSTFTYTPVTQNYVGAGWHHVAVVIVPGTSTTIYVDGTLRATNSTTPPIVYTGRGSATYLGRGSPSANTYNFTGGLDDVRIYNYARTASQILADATAPTLGTYYIAPGGSTLVNCADAQVSSTPRDSLARVAPCVTPGSTVCFAPGATYSASLRTSTLGLTAGTVAAPVVLTACPGAGTATLTGTDVAVGILSLDRGAGDHDWVFERLVFDGQNVSGMYGVSLPGAVSRVTLRNVEAKNFVEGSGVYVLNSSQITVQDSHVHHVSGSQAPVYLGGTSTVTLTGIESDTNAQPGVLLAAGNSNVTLEKSRLHNNTAPGVRLSGANSAVTIQNNLLYSNTIGMELLSGVTTTNMYYNTLWNNTTACLVAASGVATSQATNNICWQSSTITNNAGGGFGQTTNQIADPSFVSTTPGDPGFLHLAAASTARDQGTPIPSVTSDFNGDPRPKPVGGGVDKGAFEETPTTLTPPTQPPGLIAPFLGASHFLIPY